MRRLVPGVLGLVLAMTIAGTASAAKPVRGCGEGGFAPLDFDAYREILIERGVTEEQIVGARQVWLLIDHNGDDALCLKARTDTPGHSEGGGEFTAVDNTSNH